MCVDGAFWLPNAKLRAKLAMQTADKAKAADLPAKASSSQASEQSSATVPATPKVKSANGKTPPSRDAGAAANSNSAATAEPVRPQEVAQGSHNSDQKVFFLSLLDSAFAPARSTCDCLVRSLKPGCGNSHQGHVGRLTKGHTILRAIPDKSSNPLIPALSWVWIPESLPPLLPSEQTEGH